MAPEIDVFIHYRKLIEQRKADLSVLHTDGSFMRYPEFRVYRIGESYFACNINSETLDSRVDRQGSIIYLDIDTFPQDVLSKIKDLTTHIGCDFCAIDIKTDPETKELVFLELNNGPMFMGYDKTSGGTMAAEMVRYLIKKA